MYLNKHDNGLITGNFLSVAAYYFQSTENWQTDISQLLEKLNSAAGSRRVCIVHCKYGSNEKPVSFEIINSWCEGNNEVLDTQAFPVNFGESQEVISALSARQAIHLAADQLETLLPKKFKHIGLTSFSAFPVFADECLWGVLNIEFYDQKKDWNQSELDIIVEFTGLLGKAIEKEHIDRMLRVDKSYFEELFHSSPAAIVIANSKGVVERINREFTHLFQYQPEDIIGRRIDEILPSVDDQKKASQITGKILEGERISREGIRYRKDGSPVHVTILGVQSKPLDEEPTVYGIYHDITEQVLVHDKLRESEARYKSLFESANDSIFLLKEGIVFECNARTLDVFKCRREDIIGRSAIDLSPRRQPNGSLSLNLAVKYNRAAFDSEPQSFEWLHQRPDGSTFFAEVSLNMIEWNGESAAQAIVRDISLRKQTETLLRQRFDFIAFLSHISADLINLDTTLIDNAIDEALRYSSTFSGCDRAIVYLQLPDGISLQLAYKWQTINAEPISLMDQILISDLPGIYTQLAQGKTTNRELPEILTVNEDILLAEILDLKQFKSYVIVPLTVSGKLTGLAGYFSCNPDIEWNNDSITPLNLTSQMIANAIERKRVEQELKNAKEKAVESDKLKTAFLSSMSHEIRTPMNHILGFIELLKDPDLSEKEKREFMSIVRSSGNLLLRLIDDIIDIAKLESGQLEILPVELQLNKFMNDLYLAFKEQLKGSGKENIDLKFIKPRNPVCDTIITDPLRLRQIVSNLLSNAIKFTQEGRIHFGYTLEPDEKLHFFVEDTGIGIPAENHAMVFERFMQLDYSYSREYGGTGLGLAISKGLVELMQGEIGLESQPSRGSRFYFSLPYNPVLKYLQPVVKKPANVDDYNFSGKTILIVEDDEINYRFLEIVISRTKARVLRAQTGREAIDLATQQIVNLVLMDIQIPIIDGYSATRKIKSYNSSIPIIAQTAHALAEEKVRCLESGADDYLSKPINRRDLLSKMAMYLSKENDQ